MNEKTRRVFNGWMRLAEAERQELAREIERFSKAGSLEQRRILEENAYVIKVETGPITKGCPCCGR